MNILYIANVRLPTERAHGYAIMKLCEEFARAGHAVTLLTSAHKATAGKGGEDPFSYYGIEKNFTLRRVHSTDLLGRSTNVGRFSYWIDQLSFVLMAWICFSRALWRADVIYVRSYQLAACLPARKTALELHSMPEGARAGGLFAHAARRARWCIAISSGLAEAVRRMLGDGARGIVVAPDAVDVAKFSALPSRDDVRRTLGLPADKKIALYTGHFYGWKGADVLAAAAAHLPEDVLCVLVGGVDEDYERMVREYGSRENIRIVLFQPPQMMPQYLAAADVVVLPNRSGERISSTYTSPLKLFEYMASGRPIVASDLPSIREVLDERTAVLVHPDDPSALAAGIREVLADPMRAAALAEAASEKVRHYTWKKRAEGILAVLHGNGAGRCGA